MHEFTNRVAVVTGAASGIGRALAERLAQEGMHVMLADVEASALGRAVEALRAAGHDVRGTVTDVSQAADVERLAQATLDAFGKIHVVCNNAGVNGGRGHDRSVLGPPPAIWEASLADWQWITGVNYFGVAHGIRTFVPILLAQNEDGHVVNTGSMAGLTLGHNVYGVTKHAVVAMSEALYRDFRRLGTRLGVTVICPTLVSTNIYTADRNRPAALADPERPALSDDEVARLRTAWSRGFPPEHIAEQTVQAIRDDQLYLVIGTPAHDGSIRERVQAILERRNPTDPSIPASALAPDPSPTPTR